MEPLRQQLPYSEYAAYSSTYNEARKVQSKPQTVPRSIRIITRVMSLIFSGSILGISGHASAVWFLTRNIVQKQPNGMRYRAWPAHMDLWPTWVMLGAAVIAFLIHIISLLTMIGGVRRLRETNLHKWSVFSSSALAITTWVAAVVYFKLQDTKGKKNWDLWSWACSHKSLENGKMSFETMCVEMNFIFYAAVVVAALEIANLAIFGYVLRKTGGEYSKITVTKT